MNEGYFLVKKGDVTLEDGQDLFTLDWSKREASQWHSAVPDEPCEYEFTTVVNMAQHVDSVKFVVHTWLLVAGFWLQKPWIKFLEYRGRLGFLPMKMMRMWWRKDAVHLFCWPTLAIPKRPE